MRCPTCDDVQLVISSREGIEIDHCPQCRGVWLDRGELDKIIDRAAPSVVGAASAAPAAPAPDQPRYEERRYEQPRYDDRDRYRDERSYQDYKRKKKRKSFLEDIFDFD